MSFKAPWWLKNRHLQSIIPTRLRRIQDLPRQRFSIDTRDHDHLLIDAIDSGTGPLVILLHGLGGCSSSLYVLGMQQALQQAGFNTWAWNARGARVPNQTDQTYHGGRFEDVEDLIDATAQRPIALIGFSLGAAMLINTLGRNPDHPRIQAAVAISCPFEFVRNAAHLERPESWLYRRYLLNRLCRLTRNKREWGLANHQPWAAKLPTDAQLKAIHTFWQFDDQITAPLNGFKNAQDLYQSVDPNCVIKQVLHPCLLLQSEDDPMFDKGIRPQPPLPKSVEYELTSSGGHVGFVQGRWPWSAEFYAETRAVEFILSHMEPA